MSESNDSEDVDSGNDDHDESSKDDSSVDGDEPDNYGYQFMDQAALLEHIAANSKLSVAKPLAFSVSRENALGYPFVLETRLPGKLVTRVIEDMALEERLVLAEELAELIAQQEEITFAECGKIVCDNTKTRIKKLAPGKTFSDGVVVRGACDDWERHHSAASSLYELMESHIDYRCKNEKEYPAEMAKIKDILQDMKEMGWFESSELQGRNVLWNVDLRDIMVDKTESGSWHIQGMLDWEAALSLPSVLARGPPVWLWDRSDDDILPYRVKKYYHNGCWDYLPLGLYQEQSLRFFSADDKKVKERFETVMIEKLYSQYGEKARDVYLDHAYGRGRWLRRIWRFCYVGIWDIPLHLYRLSLIEKEWKEYKLATMSLPTWIRRNMARAGKQRHTLQTIRHFCDFKDGPLTDNPFNDSSSPAE